MRWNEEDYRRKVLGCWTGKNIGGTLGAPFEWQRQVNDVTFYTQDLGGEPLPNDDLDIQLLWLIALEQHGPGVDAVTLGEYFLLHVTPHWSEYGVAKMNMRSGLVPPLSGHWNNPYRHSCGAFIRSEIWACIAPGMPRVAAAYAYNDAIIDHAHGEGTHAAVFCAAVESAAFVENDLLRLLDIGLGYIPADCGVAGAVRLALQCKDEGLSWLEARDRMLEEYRGRISLSKNFRWISDEDVEKGFDTGEIGWDAPSNIGMLAIALLYGEGDFGKTVCTAVNCGEDTDCTAATAGALFGIMHGVDAIPERWKEPIGDGIKTMSINVGDIGAWRLPSTVTDLTERTLKVAKEVCRVRRLPVRFSVTEETDLSDVSADDLRCGGDGDDIYAKVFGPRYIFPAFSYVRGAPSSSCFELQVGYGEDMALVAGKPKPLSLLFINRSQFMYNLTVKVLMPEHVSVEPARAVTVFLPNDRFDEETSVVEFELCVLDGMEEGGFVRGVLSIEVDGTSSAYCVPLVFPVVGR